MFQVLAFIKYWLRQVDEHSLHPPFIFNLYNEVIKTASSNRLEKIESLRAKLLQDQTEVDLIDFGAGSRVNNGTKRQVAEIARNSSTPAKFSALLLALIKHFEYRSIFELGTSLGLNTLYLSEEESSRITTFEGDPTLTKIAQQNFESLGRKNISIVEGNIDETLKKQVSQVKSIDLAYIDANHCYEPTLRYYELIRKKCHEKSLVVFDDIHWSKEMNLAWHELKNRPEVRISIDLFEGGLLFFDPKLTQGDYVLKF